MVTFIITKDTEKESKFICMKSLNSSGLFTSLSLSRNGDRYEGEWVQNKRQGQGMYRTADGTIYDVCITIIHHI